MNVGWVYETKQLRPGFKNSLGSSPVGGARCLDLLRSAAHAFVHLLRLTRAGHDFRLNSEEKPWKHVPRTIGVSSMQAWHPVAPLLQDRLPIPHHGSARGDDFHYSTCYDPVLSKILCDNAVPRHWALLLGVLSCLGDSLRSVPVRRPGF